MREIHSSSRKGDKSTQAIVMVSDDLRRLATTGVVSQDVLDRAKEAHQFSFGDLRDPAKAENARQCASRADVVLFAMSSNTDLPAEVKAWIESWLHARKGREGTLIGFSLDRPGLHTSPSVAELYLRNAAHRAGMDYLSQMPAWIERSIPDSLESYGERAHRVTSVLNQILEAPRLPASPR